MPVPHCHRGSALCLATSRASNPKSKKSRRLEQPRGTMRPMAGVRSGGAADGRRRVRLRGALRTISSGRRGRWCAGLPVYGYTAGQRCGSEATAPFGVPHLGRACRRTRKAGFPGARNQQESHFVAMTDALLMTRRDFKVWEEVEPPAGTVYNCPVRRFLGARPCIAAAPAPPEIGVRICHRGTMPTMVAKLRNGQTVAQAVAWPSDELEGFTR
jgi:hypothetical protein